ncbi:MAG: hypothetical protein BGO77_00240 [Caedibacter sp. 37-49]|nr:MAG: hypothetical protein BGO77_00240 [Caedibacter sp. 37-49]
MRKFYNILSGSKLFLLFALFMNSSHTQALSVLPNRNSIVFNKVSSNSIVEAKVKELVANFREKIGKTGNVAIFKIIGEGNIKEVLQQQHNKGMVWEYIKDSSGEYLIARSNINGHSETHLINTLEFLISSGINIKIIWIYSERVPCETCGNSLEKFLPNGSRFYESRTAVIQVYATFAWSSTMRDDEKKSVFKAIKRRT